MKLDHDAIARLLATQWSEPDDGSYAWSKYGITESVRLEIVRLQGGRCGICTEYASLVIDHCHTTQRVRGLICGRCNTTLGQVADDGRRLRAKAARLKRSADYVERAAAMASTAAGSHAAWVAARSSRADAYRATRPSKPAPVLLPARKPAPIAVQPEAEVKPGFWDLWPTSHLRQFPTERVIVPNQCGLVHWGVWCPKDQVGPAVLRKTDASWKEFWIGSRGAACTADVMAAACDTPERSVAFYAMAFVRTWDREVGSHSRGALRSHLAEWLRDSVRPVLAGIDFNPWHWRSQSVLPEAERIGWDEVSEIASEADLVQMIALHWERTSSEWTILEFIQRSEIDSMDARMDADHAWRMSVKAERLDGSGVAL